MNFNFKKKFGQNFLINASIISKIVSAVDSYDNVIEIGPGNGALTKELLSRGKKITAIDIDKDCIDALISLNSPNLTLVNADILNYQLPNECIIGNLPYNIASKIIENLVFNSVPYAVFMVQKEVCEILTGKDFSKLTVFVQSRYLVSKLINVGPGNFQPRPKVDSQVVILKRHNKLIIDFEKLHKILSKLFAFRRKKLSFLSKLDNNLYNKALELNWDLNKRIDEISKEEIYELVNKI